MRTERKAFMLRKVLIWFMTLSLVCLCGCSSQDKGKEIVEKKSPNIYIYNAGNGDSVKTVQFEGDSFVSSDYAIVYGFNGYVLSESDIQYNEEIDTYTCITKFRKVSISSNKDNNGGNTEKSINNEELE